MLSEHGFIAFGLWLSMILGTLISLTKLMRAFKGIDEMEWVFNYSFAIRTALICYMIGTAFLGLSYWDLLYHLIFISVLIKKFAYEQAGDTLTLNKQEINKALFRRRLDKPQPYKTNQIQ